MNNWLFNTQKAQLEYYQGILMHAAPGLHEKTLKIFTEYIPKGSRILDIGAGAGAFSKRLFDAGYSVTAVDIDTEKWIPKEIDFVKLDINLGIQKSLENHEPFNAVCCMEVIEHIENPWNLLREIHSLLNIGDKLILTTPNITSFASRAFFAIKGQFPGFTEESLSYGHINPLNEFEIRTIAKYVGFSVLKVEPAGYLPIFNLSSATLGAILFNFLKAIFYLLSIEGEKKGYCLVFVLEKIDTRKNENHKKN